MDGKALGPTAYREALPRRPRFQFALILGPHALAARILAPPSPTPFTSPSLSTTGQPMTPV